MREADGTGNVNSDAPDLPASGFAEPTVFVSYSRADVALMLRIAEALESAGHRVNYDLASPTSDRPDIGISAQDEWWRRLQDMIVAADVVVLLVSPASAASRVVDEEIAFARTEGKRVIPVLCSPVDFTSTPPRLAALNVRISVIERSDDAFAASMLQLCSAIDQDLEWLRAGRALNEKVNEWRKAGRVADRLLHGDEIVEAERWSARRPRTAPAIGDDVLLFVGESRIAQEERLRVQRVQLERQRRLQRWVGALTAAALVATLIGAAFVLDRQRQLARSESVMLARVADESFTQGDYVRAMRLGALGLPSGILRPGSLEAENVFRRAAASPILERELPTRASVIQSWSSADGKLGAFVDGAGTGVSFWEIETSKRLAGDAEDRPKADVEFAVSADGKRFLSWGIDLQADSAFERGRAKDAARYGTLWTADRADSVTLTRSKTYPIRGGLVPTSDGPILTWGGASIDLWSSDFERRIATKRMKTSVKAAKDYEHGRRAVVVLENNRVEIRSLEPKDALALLAAREVGQDVWNVSVVPDVKLVLLVTRSDELIALDLDSLAVRYRGLAQLCCFDPPVIKAFPSAEGGSSLMLLNVVPRVGARLIRVATGEVWGTKFEHEAIRGAAFDDSGEQLVTFGTDDMAVIWGVRDGVGRAPISHVDQLGFFTGRAGPPGGIRGAVFLPNGAEVVLWNYDGTIRVHSTMSGGQIGGHMRHQGEARDVLLLPQRRVVTASDGPVKVWRLPEYATPLTSWTALCDSDWPRLRAARLSRKEVGGSAVSETIYQSGTAATSPALRIDDEDIRLAPILTGRESEYLCAATP